MVKKLGWKLAFALDSGLVRAKLEGVGQEIRKSQKRPEPAPTGFVEKSTVKIISLFPNLGRRALAPIAASCVVQVHAQVPRRHAEACAATRLTNVRAS